ncbi:MAG: acetolactate synthase small subunit [Verrucomicrobia bacterium]|nr:acetolactate synthase small subunit [Verrucomicrobiota bacterium]
MRHTISVLVENKFGVLTRVAGLFSGRGFNIDSLNVAPTQDPTMSRMTIVTRGDDATVDQIVKQLEKLIDSIAVTDFRDGEYVDRELVLVKVAVDSTTRPEVMQITDIFRAKIIDVQPASLTIEITGSETKVEKFIELMRPFGIKELTRTGKVASRATDFRPQALCLTRQKRVRQHPRLSVRAKQRHNNTKPGAAAHHNAHDTTWQRLISAAPWKKW